MQDLKSKTIKGVAWSSIETWSDQGISLLVFIVLSRVLAPKDFGLMALASIYMLAMQMLVKQGLTEAIVQKEKLAREHLDAVFWANLLVGTLLFAFTVTCSGLVARLFGNAELAGVVQWLSAMLLFSSLSTVQNAVMQRELRYRSLAIRTLAAAVLGGVAAVVLALFGYGVWALVAYQLIYAFVGVLLLWRASSWRPRFGFSPPHFREMFLFGVNIFAVNVIDVVNKRSDQFLIGWHLGASALGYYSVATRFYLALMSIFVAPLSRVASSTLSRMQDQPAQFLNAFYKTVELASAFAFPAFAGAFVLCPELITLCFSTKWLACVPVVRAFLCMGALYSVTVFHGAALRAMGKPNWHLNLVVLHVITNVVLYLAVVRHGITAVAIASAARAYFFLPADFFTLRKLLPIRVSEYWRRLSPQIYASLGMALLVIACKHATHGVMGWGMALALEIAVGALAYAGLIHLIRPKLMAELLGYRQILLKKRSPDAELVQNGNLKSS